MVFIKLTPFSLLGVFLITMPATMSAQLSDSDQKALDTITEGVNKFSMALYQAVKKPGENILVCPLSAEIVLALAYTGAKQTTASQIATVLNLPNDLQTVLQGHKLLLQELQGNTVLQIANKIYIEKTLEVLADFQANAVNYFQTDIGLVDFSGNPEGSRTDINNWVAQKTNNKIQDLLPQGSIDALTRMVLLNAVYYKNAWVYKFDPSLTQEEDFYVSAQNTQKVQMMSIKQKFPFRNDDNLDAKILEMPYDGNQFKMVIILPNQRDGLADVESKLANTDLTTVLSQMSTVEVNVKLPRFKIEKTMELKDILSAMGMPDIFDESRANLTGISTSEHLYASKVVQKAYIEVNEEGTEAAAATALVITAYSAIQNPRQEYFVVKYPFLYMLKKDKMILFMGSVNKFDSPVFERSGLLSSLANSRG